MFGVTLDIPVHQLKKIRSSHHQSEIDLCQIDMLQYWLDNNLAPKWNEVILALEETDQLALASQIKHDYLWSAVVSEEESTLIVSHACVEIIMTDIIMCRCVQTCSRIKCYFTSNSS